MVVAIKSAEGAILLRWASSSASASSSSSPSSMVSDMAMVMAPTNRASMTQEQTMMKKIQ